MKSQDSFDEMLSPTFKPARQSTHALQANRSDIGVGSIRMIRKPGANPTVETEPDGKYSDFATPVKQN